MTIMGWSSEYAPATALIALHAQHTRGSQPRTVRVQRAAQLAACSGNVSVPPAARVQAR